MSRRAAPDSIRKLATALLWAAAALAMARLLWRVGLPFAAYYTSAHLVAGGLLATALAALALGKLAGLSLMTLLLFGWRWRAQAWGGWPQTLRAYPRLCAALALWAGPLIWRAARPGAALEELAAPARPGYCLRRPHFHYLQTFTLVTGSR